MSIVKKTALATIVLFSMNGPANASIVNFTFGNYLPGSVLDTFNSLPLNVTNTSFTQAGFGTLTLNDEAQVVSGTTSVHADPYYDAGAVNGLTPAPAVSGPDTSNYITLYTGGTATFTLSKPDHYFGIEWGSVDAYNQLTFYDGNTVIGTFDGQTIINAVPLNAGNQGSSGTEYVNFTSALLDPITKVVASSSGVAFEFDNVRVSQQPLPAALPMFAVAMMGVGAFGMHQRKKLAVTA